MYVKSIKLINFRNYENVNINLNQGLNIFLGNNAQGKTNLMESIYIAAIGKSYRGNKDRELINFEKHQAYIGVEVETLRGNRFIELKFQRDAKKRLRVNKLELEKLSELFGNLNVVIFAPEDLNLIKDGPSVRRDFLDDEISQIKPKYRYNIQKYERILFQRNKLLKLNRGRDKSQFEPWDIQLAEIGAEILTERLRFVDKLSQISKSIHSKISGGKEELGISYISALKISEKTKAEIELEFYNALKSSLSLDLEKGTTEYGPHRDDIDININGISCRIFGSQGQQRTSALSLKLAEIELIKLEVGEYPVLLLDDVLSELDFERRRYLISTFENVQTIVTSTDQMELIDIADKSIFYIENGKVLK